MINPSATTSCQPTKLTASTTSFAFILEKNKNKLCSGKGHLRHVAAGVRLGARRHDRHRARAADFAELQTKTHGAAELRDLVHVVRRQRDPGGDDAGHGVRRGHVGG